MEANSSVESAVCRVCLCGESSISHLEENAGEPLISPCHCKGTMGLYHKSCLEHWLYTSKTTQCEICKFQYEYGVIKENIGTYFRNRGWQECDNRSPFTDLWIFLSVAPGAFYIIHYFIRTAVRAHTSASGPSPVGIGMFMAAFFIIGGLLIWLVLTINNQFAHFRQWQVKNQIVFIIDQLEQDPTQFYNSTGYNRTDGAGRPLLERNMNWFMRIICCCRRNRVANASPRMVQPYSPSARGTAHSPTASTSSSIPSASERSSSASPQSNSSVLSRASPATISLSTFGPTSVVVHRPLCTSSPVAGDGGKAEAGPSSRTEGPSHVTPPERNTGFSAVDLGSPIAVSPSSRNCSPSPVLSRLSPSQSYV